MPKVWMSAESILRANSALDDVSLDSIDREVLACFNEDASRDSKRDLSSGTLDIGYGRGHQVARQQRRSHRPWEISNRGGS